MEGALNVHVRMRNARWGLEASTSRLALANHTGLEALLLTAIVNSPIFALGPAAVSAVTTGLTAIASIGVSLGAQYLLAGKPPRPADGKAPKTQAVPPRAYGVGTNRWGGSYMLWEEKDNQLFAVVAYAGHRISQYRKWWLQDDLVTLDGAGWVQPGADGRYGEAPDRVQILSRLGLVPETAYSPAVSAFGGAGIWTAAHRGDGQASYMMRAVASSQKDFGRDYPYGIPQPSALADWAACWDFRDEDQDPEDASSWTFTKNPAVEIAWYLCFCPYGPRHDYRKALLPVLDRWKEEADICDEAVALAAGGTEPRYEAHQVATTETDPLGFLNGLLVACDGHIAQHGDGSWVLTVGKFREELVETVTDEDIAGYVYNADVDEEDEVNRLTARFTYPATDYTAATVQYLENVSAQLKVGRVLPQEADYSAVQSWTQARRLLRRDWLRIQAKANGTLDLRLSAINAITARWVRVQASAMLPEIAGRVVENKRSVLALMRGGFSMEWRLHPHATDIEAWDPATDEGTAPPVPGRPTSDPIPTPTIDGVEAMASGGSVFLRVTIVDAGRPDLTPAIFYRIADIGGGTPGDWVEYFDPDVKADGGFYAVSTNPVPADRDLEVVAAFRAAKGTSGPRSTPPEEVASTVDAVAPGPLTATAASGGRGYASCGATVPQDNTASIRIWWTASGTLDPDSPPVDAVYADYPVAPGQVLSGLTIGDSSAKTNLVDATLSWGIGLGTGWTLGAGPKLSHASGSNSSARNVGIAGVSPGDVVRGRYEVVDYVSGSIRSIATTSAATAVGASHSANGVYRDELTIPATGTGPALGGQAATSNFVGAFQGAFFYKKTPTCLRIGAGYIFMAARNRSGIYGPVSSALPVTVD